MLRIESNVASRRAVMARLAEAGPILPVPKQSTITAMRSDVMNDISTLTNTGCKALRTPRVSK